MGFLRRPGVPPPPPFELPFDLTRDDPVPLEVTMALAAEVDERVTVEVAICNKPSVASVPATLC